VITFRQALKQREIETQLLSKIPGLTELDFDKAENVSGEGEMLSRVIDITDYGDKAFEYDIRTRSPKLSNQNRVFISCSVLIC
jgi:hypothetical protein